MVRKSYIRGRQQGTLGARLAAGQLSDDEVREMTRILRDALRQAGLTLRAANGRQSRSDIITSTRAANGRKDPGGRQCCRDGTCEHGRALAERAASRDTSTGQAGQPPGKPARHVRFAHGQRTVVNSGRDAAADRAFATAARMARELQDGADR